MPETSGFVDRYTGLVIMTWGKRASAKIMSVVATKSYIYMYMYLKKTKITFLFLFP